MHQGYYYCWVILCIFCLSSHVAAISIFPKSNTSHILRRKLPEHNSTAHGILLRNAPYWKQQDQSPRAFNRTSCQQCLQGRSLFIMGHSTAREILYTAAELLGDTHVGRLEQKSLCGRVNDLLWDGCTRHTAGANLVFTYQDVMDNVNYSSRGGFPYLFKNESCNTAEQCLKGKGEDGKKMKNGYPDGIEVENMPGIGHLPWRFKPDPNDMRQELQKLLANTTVQDVLFINVGLIYVGRSHFVDYREWHRASALSFRDWLPTVFPGKVVWSLLPQLHGQWVYLNERVHEINNDLHRIWYAQNPHPWHFVDQWTINYGKKYLYEDRIHYGGLLSKACLQMLLNFICPQLGEPVHYPAFLPDDTSLHTHLFRSSEDPGEYYVAGGSHLHKIAANSSCIVLLEGYFNKTISISQEVREFLPDNANAISTMDLCKPRTLWRVARTAEFDTWYTVDPDGALKQMNSPKDLLVRGLDFSNAVYVNEPVFDLLYNAFQKAGRVKHA